MINVVNLTKRYGEKEAISDITFQVGEGEVLGFLGPNGAGKTTTMRILTGYLKASSGEASVAGHDVFSESLQVRRLIGYLPENNPLYLNMTVRSFLGFMAEINAVPKKRQKEAVDLAIQKCWLEDVQGRIIGRLSKGYRQRVGIAHAIVHNPKVLILDEPTIGLDPRQIIQVRQMIRELRRSHTLIISTHILPEVNMTCDRALIINKGKFVAMGSPDSLISRLKGENHIYIEARAPEGDLEAKLDSQSGVQRVSREGRGMLVTSDSETDLRPQLAKLVIDCGWDLLEMRTKSISLEDVFLELVTDEGSIH
jgi:ABC-2 type transport system ATP-binding protein